MMNVMKYEQQYSKINIVILMAGAGNRFKLAGYSVPKPFICFNGKMMVEHVMSSFDDIDATFTFVVLEQFLVDQKLQIEKLRCKYNVNFVTVPKVTLGASISALAAHRYINSDSDIIFADSDNIFNKRDIAEFIVNVRSRRLDGALLTFNSKLDCYSYVMVDDNGFLLVAKEKEVISNHAIAGIYYFRNKELFVNSVIDLIVENDLSKGEYYMSGVYNHLRKFTKRIGIVDIEAFDCVGTPSQLKAYIERNNYGTI